MSEDSAGKSHGNSKEPLHPISHIHNEFRGNDNIPTKQKIAPKFEFTSILAEEKAKQQPVIPSKAKTRLK